MCFLINKCVSQLQFVLIAIAIAHATSYRRNASTGNQLYKPKQTVIDAGVKVKVRDPLGPPEPLY